MPSVPDVSTPVPPEPPPAPHPEPFGAPGGDGDPLVAALARWDAARSSTGPAPVPPSRTPSEPSAEPHAEGPALPPTSHGAGAPPAPRAAVIEDAAGDELAARVTARRAAGTAARHAATAYAATHGHVPAEGDGGRVRRWALGGRTALVAAVAVLVVAAGTALAAWPRGGAVEPLTTTTAAPVGDDPAAVPDPSAAAGSDAAAVPSAAPGPVGTVPAGDGAGEAGVVVHVVGQVGAPGLVTLPDGARVADAVDAAGGPTDEADLSAVNLARAVVDGEQLRVPAPGEEVTAPPAPTGAGGTGSAGGGSGAAAGGVVDLNSADEAALNTLPGIGPALAGRILAWREEHGPFTSVEELDEVSGIGPAMLERLRDLVRV